MEEIIKTVLLVIGMYILSVEMFKICKIFRKAIKESGSIIVLSPMVINILIVLSFVSTLGNLYCIIHGEGIKNYWAFVCSIIAFSSLIKSELVIKTKGAYILDKVEIPNDYMHNFTIKSMFGIPFIKVMIIQYQGKNLSTTISKKNIDKMYSEEHFD